MSTDPGEAFKTLLHYFRYDAGGDTDEEWELLKQETLNQFNAGKEAAIFYMWDGQPCRIIAAKTQELLDTIVAAKNP